MSSAKLSLPQSPENRLCPAGFRPRCGRPAGLYVYLQILHGCGGGRHRPRRIPVAGGARFRCGHRPPHGMVVRHIDVDHGTAAAVYPVRRRPADRFHRLPVCAPRERPRATEDAVVNCRYPGSFPFVGTPQCLRCQALLVFRKSEIDQSQPTVYDSGIGLCRRPCRPTSSTTAN